MILQPHSFSSSSWSPKRSFFHSSSPVSLTLPFYPVSTSFQGSTHHSYLKNWFCQQAPVSLSSEPTFHTLLCYDAATRTLNHVSPLLGGSQFGSSRIGYTKGRGWPRAEGEGTCSFLSAHCSWKCHLSNSLSLDLTGGFAFLFSPIHITSLVVPGDGPTASSQQSGSQLCEVPFPRHQLQPFPFDLPGTTTSAPPHWYLLPFPILQFLILNPLY